MGRFLQRELEKLKTLLLQLGTLVEERFHTATSAIHSRDLAAADRVITSDSEIDAMEVEVEEECLKIIALYQPVAVDLRFLVGVIKINNDLERIGDLAVNIARRVKTLARHNRNVAFYDYGPMAEATGRMLKKSLDSFVNMDSGLANRVREMDDEVDRMNREAYDRARDAMARNPDAVGDLINMFLIARHLERVADHCTNVAEEVLYMVEGEIVRHGRKGNV